MKVKSLLVGAEASFVGPWVNLEEGDWLVGSFPGILQGDDEDGTISPALENIRADGDGTLNELQNDGAVIQGPIRLRAIVSDDYIGAGVYLQAKEQESESDSGTNEVPG